MDFDINNYLIDNKPLSYSELEELLKNRNKENREKFVKGYLSYLKDDALNAYNKNKYVFYNYNFNDFFQDCIIMVYKIYDSCFISKKMIKNMFLLVNLDGL